MPSSLCHLCSQQWYRDGLIKSCRTEPEGSSSQHVGHHSSDTLSLPDIGVGDSSDILIQTVKTQRTRRTLAWFCRVCVIAPGVRSTATSSTTTAQSGWHLVSLDEARSMRHIAIKSESWHTNSTGTSPPNQKRWPSSYEPADRIAVTGHWQHDVSEDKLTFNVNSKWSLI